MKIKNICCIFFVLFGWFLCEGQDTINTITRFNDNNTIFTESTWVNDTLYVAGTTIFGDGSKATIIKYLKDGTFIDVYFVTDTAENYAFGFWDSGLLVLGDTIYNIATKGYAGSVLKSVIFKLDKFGNIYSEKEFSSYYFPADDFCRFRDFIKVDNGFIILDYARKTGTDFKCCLIRVDNNFNQIWRNCYGTTQSLKFPNSVHQLSNGNILVVANSSNLENNETFTGSGNGYFQGYIFETDPEGNLIWQWTEPSKMNAANVGYLENDSTLIIAAGLGKEVCSDSQSDAHCFFTWTGGVYKLNLKNRTKIWETRLSGGPHALMFDNSYYDIIPSIEKDGYILCGSGYTIIPDCRTDTIDKCWAFPGVIAKVSNEGDSVWMRKYFGVTDIYESNVLYDAEISPDLGYSFVGEAFNPWPGETQGQHGWVLKTDKFGCLVPGCQLVSSTEDETTEINQLDPPFKTYPNPASDYINVLITRSVSNNSVLHLTNSMGQEIFSWKYFEKGATYILPVSDLPRGVYILTLTNNNELLGIEKIVLK